MFLWIVFILIVFGILLGLLMLSCPKFFVRQTLHWNNWFLKRMGYEVQISSNQKAEIVMRMLGGCSLLLFLIGLSLGFDVFLMLFK